MKMDGLDHPKTLDFAARLDVILPQAIGHLELLWAFVAQKTPHGNVGKWPDGAIARASQWSGDPTAFVTALCEAGFLDEHPVHRYIVHDWQEHAPRWVASKLSRAKESFCAPHNPSAETTPQSKNPDSSAESTEDSSGDYSPDGSADSKPGQAKSSQAKPSEGESPPPADADEPRDPADLDDEKPDEREIPKLAIDHLNHICGTRYQKTKKNLGFINARVGEGASLDEFKLVIEFKHREWSGDPSMAQYLRPETLFGPSKFPGYLAAAKAKRVDRDPGHGQQGYNPDLSRAMDTSRGFFDD